MSKRKIKKFRKNSHLIIDLAAIPEGVSLEKWLEVMNVHRIMLWDSQNFKDTYIGVPFKFITTTRIKCPYTIKVGNNESI